jgi:hypothetical protein
MSLAEIEARHPTYLTSYPAYLPWVMQWADVGIRERSTCTQLNRVSGRSGAVSVGGHEAGSPMQVFVSPDDDRRAGGCAPLTPGGEATGSRANGFR